MKIYYDPKVLDYELPKGIFDSFPSPLLDQQMDQPEGPDRIRNTVSALRNGPLSDLLEWATPSPATDQDILTFHTQAHLDRLKEANAKGDYLSASTYLEKGGMRFIYLSAGAAMSAIRHITQGHGKLSYAIGRPPNHHAQPDHADGYCFVNGIAMAVLEAKTAGYEKIAVVDWDVHHGNGTQAGFYHRDDVLTISMHMDHGSWGKTHPETGAVDETGSGPGEGFNLNLPLPFGSGNQLYTKVFEHCVVPALEQFRPDLIIVSNGQDANQFDPNGRQMVTMNGFHQMATQLRQSADKLCDGKIMMTQEGGYNPTYAPLCAYAVAAGIMSQALYIPDPIAFYPDDHIRAERDFDELVAKHPLL